MLIRQIAVEEGFLRDLELEFGPGLNVVIGERGTGKTSIIELIRFCLGVPAYHDRFATRGREHALAILAEGRVTVTIEANGETFSVSRTADDDEPRITNGGLFKPIILSQNEIETIGLNSKSRRMLIDEFCGFSRSQILLERKYSKQASVTTEEISKLNEEISNLAESAAALKQDTSDIEKILEQESEIRATIEGSKTEREQLNRLSDQLSRLRSKEKVFDEATNSLGDWVDRGNELLDDWPELDNWIDELEEDPFESFRSSLEKSLTDFESTLEEIQATLEKIESERIKVVSLLEGTRNDARKLRSHLEEIQEGAGKIASRLSKIREQQKEEESLRARGRRLMEERKELIARRGESLDKLDQARDQRFSMRQKAAKALNDSLKPTVKIKLQQNAAHGEYVNAILSALSGSRIRASQIAPKLAQNMNPRELIEAIEEFDSNTIANIVQISNDRAERLVSALSLSDMAHIITCVIEDEVKISLFDAHDYKDSEELSMGQRCTAILPIILEKRGRPLVLDQPEDNLDNAFIANTVVASIRRAANDGQLIVSTHNPNIPVLGEADRVVRLGSDGKRGYVESEGELDEPEIVESITTIMEGGAEAFRKRAAFYRTHQNSEL